MTAFTFHLSKASDIKFMEQLAKKLNIPYEKTEDKRNHSQELKNVIEEGISDFKNGKTTKVDIKNLWK